MEFAFAVLTLAFLEIVLGIDNIMFISLVTNELSLKRTKLVKLKVYSSVNKHFNKTSSFLLIN